MNSSDLSIADRLTQLIAQRESFQIGEYEFETQKRAALQLSPAGLHPVVRNLLAFLIVNCASLGFAIAFPDYAKLALIVIGILQKHRVRTMCSRTVFAMMRTPLSCILHYIL